MDQQQQVTEATPRTSVPTPVHVVILTTVTIVEHKHISEVTETTYADGSTKQDRHDRTEINISVDRDDYTEAPQTEV
ncbi:hypothetical protein QFC22_006404 [Naganishia vaughanmartiniae]|uniref:Uncharacterized protein n=1 Tax=Naganishia vaughanmartiniae TaxID=1424756 RepID=A0ACC2WK34_9TREE|nr:hypothetical protein QFC22_006404 [Naganishia vaughanmartiniae]